MIYHDLRHKNRSGRPCQQNAETITTCGYFFISSAVHGCSSCYHNQSGWSQFAPRCFQGSVVSDFDGRARRLQYSNEACFDFVNVNTVNVKETAERLLQ